jgi:uncharacterized lipoprotein YmbA
LIRWGVLLVAALLAACSSGTSTGENTAASEDLASNAAAVPLDENSADMNAAEIVPDDEGGTEDEPGAKPQ